jgi:defect-in-organelle-trafficking protein DotC
MARAGYRSRVSVALVGLLAASMAVTSARAAMDPSEASLETLTQGSQSAAAAAAVPNAREEAVREAGQATGMAWGYYHEIRRLEAEMNAEVGTLNQVYAFQPYMLRGHVLPPVLEAGDHAAKFNNPNRATFALQIFKIIHPARIVAAPPDWRQWLLPPNPHPHPTRAILLPRNAAERAVWKAAVASGWTQGVEQGQSVEMENLHRLTRTLTGMIMFMRLKAQGMVSGPVVVAGAPVIQVQGQKLSIDTRLFQIDQPAQFAPEKYWNGTAPRGITNPRPADDAQ